MKHIQEFKWYTKSAYDNIFAMLSTVNMEGDITEEFRHDIVHSVLFPFWFRMLIHWMLLDEIS